MNTQSLLETLTRLRFPPREAATVEFKSNLEDPAEIGQYLSALANTAGSFRNREKGIASPFTAQALSPFLRKGVSNPFSILEIPIEWAPFSLRSPKRPRATNRELEAIIFGESNAIAAI